MKTLLLSLAAFVKGKIILTGKLTTSEIVWSNGQFTRLEVTPPMNGPLNFDHFLDQNAITYKVENQTKTMVERVTLTKDGTMYCKTGIKSGKICLTREKNVLMKREE